jgi:hypothetical protein
MTEPLFSAELAEQLVLDADHTDDELVRMLTAALAWNRALEAEIERREKAHAADIERRDVLHIAEMERRDVLHHQEMVRRHEAYEHELEAIRAALETRDLIGQAKGIIIASMGCSADEAFVVLKKQSQAENRRLNEIAAEISAKAQRRR